MTAEQDFARIAGLLSEPARARILWHLRHGNAATASELAIAAEISATSASNHLAKLVNAGMVKAELQSRNRYYSFARPEVARAVESLAELAGNSAGATGATAKPMAGIRFCRTCYDHLAGHAGVKVTEALEGMGIILKQDGKAYAVTDKGWNWFAQFGIEPEHFSSSRRRLTRQCLDWTERRPHLAGHLGATFLQKMRDRNWFTRVEGTRELAVTPKGREQLKALLGVELE